MAPRKRNPIGFNPGFQSPADNVGGFTPAFQSIEGLTPRSRSAGGSSNRTTVTPAQAAGGQAPSQGSRDITSVQLPDGRRFVGLSQRDFRNLLSVSPFAVPFGPAPQQGPLAQQVEASNAAAAAGVGQNIPAVGGALPEGVAEGTEGSLFAAGLGGAAGGAASLGALGLVGGPPGAVVGAATGTVLGFAAGVYGKLRSNERQGIKEDFANFQTSTNNLASIIDMVNQGLVDPYEATALFNLELAKIDRAESNLKKRTDDDTRAFLGDAGDELIKVQSFNDLQRAQYTAGLIQAIQAPNPKQVITRPDFSIQEEDGGLFGLGI